MNPVSRQLAMPLANANAPGAMSAALFSKITDATVLKAEACPAFVTSAATWAPGANMCAELVIESSRTLAGNCTLTLSVTGALQGSYVVTCRALALGYTITIAAPSGNLAVIPASLTGSRSAIVYFDGTGFIFNGWTWVL